jgi:hypothetical protein
MGKKSTIVLLAAFFLNACTPEMQANMRRNTGRQTTQDMQQECIGFGFKKGTKDFSNCMMQLSIKNDQVRSNNSARAMQQQQMQQQMMLQQPRGFTCQSYGNMTTCN